MSTEVRPPVAFAKFGVGDAVVTIHKTASELYAVGECGVVTCVEACERLASHCNDLQWEVGDKIGDGPGAVIHWVRYYLEASPTLYYEPDVFETVEEAIVECGRLNK